jgi:dephospho-CoA kinase
MLRVALTGGIATGKSHVLRRLASHGVPTIDADVLAHASVRPGSQAWSALRARFGPDIFATNGEVDRRRIGQAVFSDPLARRDLEAIVHPPVYDAIQQWFGERASRQRHTFAVADIPLLFETGHQEDFDRVVVTACNEETQLQRLIERDGLSEADARSRMASQLPTADKVTAADYVIWTDGSQDDTDRHVDDVYRALMRS